MRKKQILVRITEELHQKLKVLAAKKGISVNALIAMTLWEQLKDSSRP